MQIKTLFTTLTCALMSQTALADHHAHEAHVHGEVSFHIAQDGHQLLVEIEAPGADVVGFEHAPTNAAERQALKQAQAILLDGASLLQFPASADCQLIESEAENDAESHSEHAAHDGHHHDEHQHHDEHDEHDEHHNHDAHRDSHNTFQSHYLFECANVAALDNIKVTWFTHFPATQRIEAHLFLDDWQGTQALTPQQTTMTLHQ